MFKKNLLKLKIFCLKVQPPKTSKLFKNSVVKIGSTSLSPTTVTQPNAEIWRSEAFLQIIINFWLTVPDQMSSNPFVKLKTEVNITFIIKKKQSKYSHRNN